MNNCEKDEVEGARAPLIAILAAGGSTRMRGGDKLLEPVRGLPLLRLLAQRAIATGADVAVTLPPGGPRWAALDGMDLMRLAVPDAATGMAASFRAIAAISPERAVMVVLGDMPEIEVADLTAMIAAWRRAPDRVLRATTAGGRPGQPVVFPPDLVAGFATLIGDSGGQALIRGHPVLPVSLPGQRAITDLDTPEDWAAWRARTGCWA